MPASCTGGFNWGLLHYVYSLRILQKRFLMRYYCLRRGRPNSIGGELLSEEMTLVPRMEQGKAFPVHLVQGLGNVEENILNPFTE